MGRLLSVVIDIINVLRVSIKAENHPPVGTNDHRPIPSHLALKWMQSKSRQIHVGNGWGGVERRQDIPNLVNVFRVNPTWIVVFKKPFQAFVANRPYHNLP